jgi:hypothetical protein
VVPCVAVMVKEQTGKDVPKFELHVPSKGGGNTERYCHVVSCYDAGCCLDRLSAEACLSLSEGSADVGAGRSLFQARAELLRAQIWRAEHDL